MNRVHSPNGPIESTDEDLLELYLSLPTNERNERFANTTRTAEMTGLSIRTIQFWMEVGEVRGVRIGKKHWIDLQSLRDYLKARMQRLSA